jgi:hypothetical protein
MFEVFDFHSRTKIRRDSLQVTRDLVHDKHVVSAAATAEQAAQEYLRRFHAHLGMKLEELKSLHLPLERDPIDASVEYRLHAEKQQFNGTTVSYYQTVFGLPVWEAGLAVHIESTKRIKQAPFRIVGAQSTRHADIQVTKPSVKAFARLKRLDTRTLAKLIGIADEQNDFDIRSLRVLHRRLMIYRYQASKRVAPPDHEPTQTKSGSAMALPVLPLPSLSPRIVGGRHYVVAALDFRLESPPVGVLHWVALVEAQTLAVLYLRVLVDHICGLVFRADPMTVAGGPPPGASNITLNRLRRSVTLRGLRSCHGAKTFALRGEIIRIADFEPPTAKPPIVPKGGAFNYKARTNNFAAVNAYYHCDHFFRLVGNLGFERRSYFKPTKFPLPIDHRGRVGEINGIEINARCQGNTTAAGGLLNVRFALADIDDTANPIGIACDWRTVLHELGGHGTLWNHINYGMFSFAHSAGDSLAAILNDPDTQMTGNNRCITFPWLPVLDRRHDRRVEEGWGWGGTKDLGVNERRKRDPKGYQSEQILSTTHFRLYRSIGGDAVHLKERRFAARFVSYLILRAIGSMTPAHAPDDVAAYAAALMFADAGDWTSEGHAGGAYAKVIRWAFEKQGLYQAPGAPRPVTKEGAPPLVDVYIEDGRNGEYHFQANYWSSRAIWNRVANDRGTTHQEPVAGITNFAYVKIKNRGTRIATGVTVKGFHCKAAAGQVFPDDWVPMTTGELRAPDVPPNSASEIIVGPFAWEPSGAGCDCMMMVVAAAADASNIDNLNAGKSIPVWRLVPHDNNIALRSVQLLNAEGPKRLVAAFEALQIYVKNPHPKRTRMVIKPILPPLLARLGWKLEPAGPGRWEFSLKAGRGRRVAMRLSQGNAFAPGDVKGARNRMIHIEVYAQDILVGGVSYMLDAACNTPATQTRFSLRSRGSDRQRARRKRSRARKTSVHISKALLYGREARDS